MRVLNFIFENWLLLLFPAIIVCGIIIRAVTHKPFRGDIPPVGVFGDLPENVTGMKKPDGKVGK